MSGQWGKKVKYSIFGESHGRGIGITIDGLPPGIKLDMDFINGEMQRRAPGRDEFSTKRKEGDKVEILSGYFNGYTTGTPLCGVIFNENQNSKDYDKLKNLARPGHADFTGKVKYSGFNDYRGGGHFSGRITAPLVFAGAVAKQILFDKGIVIGSHILSIGNVFDNYFDGVNLKIQTLADVLRKDFPVLDDLKGKEMKNIILKAKEETDSVGGIIEGSILNLPCGLGEPFFDSLESNLAQLLFSVPAVKGVEFGMGFEITKIRGSKANDVPYIYKEKVLTKTNNNGGINGGISNGMPVIFRVAMKPTPSIAKTQNTIDMATGENSEISVIGRHDPCIVLRALPVIEACAAMSILDFI
ncbi:chorismate synthase [Clostridium estertheticum]|uniref:chorismate synthase n=1 Tax=Clostridium estertheticum TaxID=238834 RepID=UPI001C0D4631|nr:chorismate synthase [Clostridium estertheticum]MBU3218022.1 chorismate synthase [Clostridium estertheticum]WAG55370.1 chorismate synthase [Clostridium estertheticum]